VTNEQRIRELELKISQNKSEISQNNRRIEPLEVRRSKKIEADTERLLRSSSSPLDILSAGFYMCPEIDKLLASNNVLELENKRCNDELDIICPVRRAKKAEEAERKRIADIAAAERRRISEAEAAIRNAENAIKAAKKKRSQKVISTILFAITSVCLLQSIAILFMLISTYLHSIVYAPFSTGLMRTFEPTGGVLPTV